MACCPLSLADNKVLNFEQEEEMIFSATEKYPVDIITEDSGSLTGLYERLYEEGRGGYDILHITGHATLDPDKGPFVFVLMPNAPGFPQIYTWIKETVEKAGLTCDRVEHQAFTGEIMDKIREGIHKAGIIIADTTNNNSNVLYEIGVAHEAGKEVILLTQDIKSVHFDLKVMKHIIYSKGDQHYFKDELGQRLEAYKNPKP
jgi:hypothetical protein